MGLLATVSCTDRHQSCDDKAANADDEDEDDDGGGDDDDDEEVTRISMKSMMINSSLQY